MNFKNKLSKIISLALVISALLVSTATVFCATEQAGKMMDMAGSYPQEVLSSEVLSMHNYIVIDSLEKAKMLVQKDKEEVCERWSQEKESVPKKVANAFENFCNSRYVEVNIKERPTYLKEERILNPNEQSKILDCNYTDKMLLEDFCEYCSKNQINLAKQGQENLMKQISVLRANTAEQMILDYFMINDYPISYGMFLHSITANPKNLYYSLEGVNAYKVNCGSMLLAPDFAYEFLHEQGFLKMIYNFSKKGAWEENTDGHHYEFNTGDLAYSIHGTTNIRLHRMPSTKTYFRLWDIYDFDGDLARILNMTTNTSTYGIIVEGSYKWN